jgi:hypothetical protein
MKTVINIKQLIGKVEIATPPCANGSHSNLHHEHLEKQLSQATESCLSAVLSAVHNAAKTHDKGSPDEISVKERH